VYLDDSILIPGDVLMDIDKFLKLAVDYLSDYFASFVATLQNPGLRYQPVPEPASTPLPGSAEIASPTGKAPQGSRLEPRLFSFVLLSILIGSILNAQIPGGRGMRTDFLNTAVLTLAVWFFYSVVIHAVTRLVGSKASFWETLSVSLQVFSALYVVCSFTGLLWGALVTSPQVRAVLLGLHWEPLSNLVNNPTMMYFLVQVVLLAIYLPLAMKHVHQLNRVEQVLLGMLALVIVLIGYTIYPIFGFLLQPQ
jgi:hypothetical protein